MNKVIIPRNDRVLVAPIDDNTSSGGIVLISEQDKLHGTVLAIGPGRQNAAGKMVPITDLRVGDTVIYGNVQTTIEDEQDGKKVLLMQADAIVGIIK